LGDKENPTPIQRFFNGSLWFIATSRNAIIIIIASIIGGFLCGPGVDPIDYPFYVTGKYIQEFLQIELYLKINK